MAHIGDVIEYLRPNGEWILRGSTYEDIEFTGDEPAFTKKQFEAAFEIVDKLQIEKLQAKEAAKLSAESKLNALGLTPEEIAAIRG